VGWWDLEDAALQIQEQTFSEPVTYLTGAPPDGFPTRGIFDVPPVAADLGLARDLSDQAPWVGFRVAELPGGTLPRLGDRLTVRGVDWEVSDIQPDGGGHVRCRLFRSGPWAPCPPPPLDPAPTPMARAR
jgi:hypothetical protein